MKHYLETMSPDMVLMPIGKDTNKTHQWVYTVFKEWATETNRKIVAFYCEDPKTTDIRPDLYVLFNEKSAAWKRDLLKIHDSQQQRNIRQNGSGFDERILGLNRAGFERLMKSQDMVDQSACYAEVFEVEIFK